MKTFFCFHPGCAFFALTKHGLETHCNVAHERKVSSSLETHNYPSLANGSERNILCCTNRNRAKKPLIDCYLESSIISGTYSGDSDEIREALMKIFNSQVPGETNLMLNEGEGDDSFSLLLNKFVCVNNDIEYLLSSFLHTLLRIHYKQLETFLRKFQSMSDIRTYTKGALAKEIKSVGFTRQTYVAASGIEFTRYTKNPVIVS